MIRHIHLAKSLIKQLDVLGKAGRKGELAVDRYKDLVRGIRQKGRQCEDVVAKRTRHGELRLKNCVKYDLGGGYRLVTVRQGEHLFLLFIGSHDETDQWLERHRNKIFSPQDPSYCCETLPCQKNEPQHPAASSLTRENLGFDPYEDGLRERLDQSLLSLVFCGLYRSDSLEKSEKLQS
jgi:hypothetical protein